MTMQTIMIMTINDYDYAKQSTISIIIEPAQLASIFLFIQKCMDHLSVTCAIPTGTKWHEILCTGI